MRKENRYKYFSEISSALSTFGWANRMLFRRWREFMVADKGKKRCYQIGEKKLEFEGWLERNVDVSKKKHEASWEDISEVDKYVWLNLDSRTMPLIDLRMNPWRQPLMQNVIFEVSTSYLTPSVDLNMIQFSPPNLWYSLHNNSNSLATFHDKIPFFN
jgi:hypothetical protein